MVSIRDPIHGDLKFSGVIEAIIATDAFQRLASVKQLGLTDKVYPGATHTRFAHSIGACYLAGELAKRFSLPAQDAVLLQVAALLHDIGHYDFSHALERIAPCDHEENGRRIIQGAALPNRENDLREVLERNGIDVPALLRLLAGGEGFPAYYHEVLSSRIIDVDRMDYLKRDTYYTGAVIGEIDVSRLLNVLVATPEGQLGIKEKGVASLEQFLMARLHMYRQVYLHPDTHVAEAMLELAVRQHLELAMPMLYGDQHLLARLLEHGSPRAQELVRRLQRGKSALYQQAIVVADNDPLAAKAMALATAQPLDLLRKRVAGIAGVTEDDLIIAFSAPRDMHIPAFPVLLEDGTWQDLFTLSPLAKAVFTQRAMTRLFGVYAMPAHCDAVRAAVIGLLR